MSTQAKLNQLVRLVNGDKEAIKRLVNAAMVKHPNQKADWILDQVEFQLLRDRA